MELAGFRGSNIWVGSLILLNFTVNPYIESSIAGYPAQDKCFFLRYSINFFLFFFFKHSHEPLEVNKVSLLKKIKPKQLRGGPCAEAKKKLHIKSWYTDLEQTPLNRRQQLPAPYKRLIHEETKPTNGLLRDRLNNTWTKNRPL